MTCLRSTRAALLVLPLFSMAACASRQSPSHLPDTPPMRVQVANDGPEIVRIMFVTNGGYRSRIGTVPPLSTESFIPRVNVKAAGYFLVERASGAGATVISGEYDPQLLAGERVRIRIGEQSVGDYWLIDRHSGAQR